MRITKVLIFLLPLLLAFTSTSFASEFSRLRDTFGDWKVRHVYDEETLQYRFSDAKTFLTLGNDRKLPAQINRTSDGKFEFRFKYGVGAYEDWGLFGVGKWVTKVAIEIEGKKYNFRSETGLKVHEFMATVGTDFLRALADAKSPASVHIYVDDKFAGIASLPVNGSSAALRWLRALVARPPTNTNDAASKVCSSNEDHSAFSMAKKIQDAVRGRSLENMFALFKSDRTAFSHKLPRYKDVKGKTFNDIFPAEWQQKVLASPPECKPVGWRGYMLAHGLVWYDREGIFSLNDINRLNPLPEGGIWAFKNYGLTPACFVREWMSGDNYAEIERRYIDDQLPESIYFYKKPGLSLAKSLPFHPIAAWDREDINIVRPLEKCALPVANIKLDGSWVQGKGGELVGSHEYSVIETLPLSLCSILAPHVEQQRCLGIKLIETLDEGGGSIGQVSEFHIFGLVSDANSEVFVAPLENLETYNEAVDRVDSLLGR